MEETELNKALIRNQFSDKEIFFTMEHRSYVKKKTYIGYQIRNIGETDLFVTIKNIGFHIGLHGWFGEKEWVDFYNTNFRINHERGYNKEEFKIINNEDEEKKVHEIYRTKYKPPTTYKIPPGNYFYVLGGTSSDAYNNINVFETADISFSDTIINGAVLFDVKGKAEGALFFYDDYKKIQEDNKSHVPYLTENENGAQYKGYEEYHGVVDGYAFWEFSDCNSSRYLQVKLITII